LPEAVDLIYLDPPFNSKREHNLPFKSPKGQASEARIEAFEDPWHWNPQTDETVLLPRAQARLRRRLARREPIYVRHNRKYDAHKSGHERHNHNYDRLEPDYDKHNRRHDEHNRDYDDLENAS
jgi:adenine specific DNA methylase Mod